MNNRMDMNDGSKLEKAEQLVARNADKLEHAMENLTDKVEESSGKIHHAVDLGIRQKDELLRLKDQAKEKLTPIFRQARGASKQLFSRIKNNPAPFGFGALAIIGVLAYFGFFSSRRHNQDFDAGESEFLAA